LTHATTDTIRAALRARIDQGESIRSIAREAGYCDHSQLARFLRGERGLATGEKLDGLLRVLGLQVKERGDG
jgi:transcriptional regulator with XRE-family HTH domain